jgi:flagellar hook-basal body complex protein FliE
MYRIEKAELSLRLLVELRNKALESYQEIMRMQV